MTAKQLAILNSLVTYAAEHIPGGLSEDEREVAKIVGRWALQPEKTSRIKYAPTFVGFTREREKIVVYKNVDNEGELHIKRGDGVLRALGPDWKIDTAFDRIHDQFQILISSPQFSGEAIGQRTDLIQEDGIRLWGS